MAYSVGSISFSLACICIVLCSTYPAAVFSKPTRSSQLEQSEKELKRASKFDVTTLATEVKESLFEETKATEHPPDNSKRTKLAKFAELEIEGTTEKVAKKSSKSKQDASAAVDNEQIEKSKQRKTLGSKDSSTEDFADSQKEQRTADEVGFEVLFSKGSSDAAQASNGDGEASNKGASEEGAREDSQTPDKTGEKSSKREKKLADDAAEAEALPSAERQRGKMADTTPNPTSTSVPAVPTTGSSATINIPRATCSFALALIAVFAAL